MHTGGKTVRWWEELSYSIRYFHLRCEARITIEELFNFINLLHRNNECLCHYFVKDARHPIIRTGHANVVGQAGVNHSQGAAKTTV